MEIHRQSDTVNPTGSVKIVEATPSDNRGDDEKSPFENFESLTSKLLKVPKEELDEKRTDREKARKRKDG